MVGIPRDFQTKKDYENAVDYVIKNQTGISVMMSRLKNLKDDVYINVLKEFSKSKPSEELTQEDYERVESPACEKNRLGITDEEIGKMMVRLRSAREE